MQEIGLAMAFCIGAFGEHSRLKRLRPSTHFEARLPRLPKSLGHDVYVDLDWRVRFLPLVLHQTQIYKSNPIGFC
jgi:hypothetical protein